MIKKMRSLDGLTKMDTYIQTLSADSVSTEEDGRKLKNIYIDLILKKIALEVWGI